VRVAWGNEDNLSFSQRWNPWASDLPFITLAHHPVIYNNKEQETVTYNVDDFCDTLRELAPKALAAKGVETPLQVKEGEPIMIESYASLSSMIFNQSHLGFNRDRNGLNF
jgi:hypothetical protein